MASRYIYEPTDDGYRVHHPTLGFIGTITREIHAGGVRWWKPTTPDGETAPAAPYGRDASAGWLHTAADPTRFDTKPTPDAILVAIRSHLENGDRNTAIAVMLAALSDDIQQMRDGRRTHPAAVWAHLDRYSSWLAAAGFRVADNAPVDRLSHLRHLRAAESA